jgi:hypothetical protein
VISKALHPLALQVLKLAKDLADLTDAGKAYRPRRFSQAATNVPNGNSTLAITWSPDITTPGYVVVATVVTGAGNVGQVFAAVQNGSTAPGGCTLLIRNTSGGTVSAGLDVAIHPVPTAAAS